MDKPRAETSAKIMRTVADAILSGSLDEDMQWQMLTTVSKQVLNKYIQYLSIERGK